MDTWKLHKLFHYQTLMTEIISTCPLTWCTAIYLQSFQPYFLAAYSRHKTNKGHRRTIQTLPFFIPRSFHCGFLFFVSNRVVWIQGAHGIISILSSRPCSALADPSCREPTSTPRILRAIRPLKSLTEFSKRQFCIAVSKSSYKLFPIAEYEQAWFTPAHAVSRWINSSFSILDRTRWPSAEVHNQVGRDWPF